MTKSRIQILKAQAVAAGKKLNIGITKTGWKKLKAAARKDPNLNVEQYFLLLQQRDIKKMWDDMTPEEQDAMTEKLTLAKAEKEAAEQEAALKLKEEEEILNESLENRRRRTYKEC